MFDYEYSFVKDQNSNYRCYSIKNTSDMINSDYEEIKIINQNRKKIRILFELYNLILAEIIEKIMNTFKLYSIVEL